MRAMAGECVGQGVDRHRGLQLIKRRGTLHVDGYSFAGQQVEIVIRKLSVEIAEGDVCTARQDRRFQSDGVTVGGLSDRALNFRDDRQFEVVSDIEKNLVAGNLLARDFEVDDQEVAVAIRFRGIGKQVVLIQRQVNCTRCGGDLNILRLLREHVS